MLSLYHSVTTHFNANFVFFFLKGALNIGLALPYSLQQHLHPDGQTISLEQDGCDPHEHPLAAPHPAPPGLLLLPGRKMPSPPVTLGHLAAASLGDPPHLPLLCPSHPLLSHGDLS